MVTHDWALLGVMRNYRKVGSGRPSVFLEGVLSCLSQRSSQSRRILPKRYLDILTPRYRTSEEHDGYGREPSDHAEHVSNDILVDKRACSKYADST
jgi:hypothetical protein